MKQVIDNFSTGGADYARYRPESPQGVYDFIYANAKNYNTAWDCGTGNGQVASKLAERFKTVYGTDISDDQLKYAPPKDNVIYRKERVEQTSFEDKSIDLITVGQAIHWFDFEHFYKEVRRVAAPDAFFAAWTYSLLRLTPEINEVIEHFYFNITRGYWDIQRAYVDAEYKSIPFPFKEIQAPEIVSVKMTTLEELLGYMRTWSGTMRYIRMENRDPTDLIVKDLERAWGSAERNEVRWPIHVRAGFVTAPR
jgi:SAM-dependent methyltransferase